MKKGYWVVVNRLVSDESAVKAYGVWPCQRLIHSADAF